MESSSVQQEERRSRLLGNPQFWSIVIIFILITLHQYDNLTSFRIMSWPDMPLGITRHTIDRILYLVPIILSSLIFGSKGGLITVFAAFVVMLPRALLISPSPMTALWETTVITLIGSLAPLGLDHYRKQEEQLEETKEQLESTQRELHSTVELSREQERQLAVINAFSAMMSQSLELEYIMRATLDMVTRLMQVDAVLVFSLDDDAKTLRLVAHKGIRDESAKNLDGVKLGDGLCGHAAKTGKPLLIEGQDLDGDLWRKLSLGDEDLQTVLGVPLVAHGSIIGTLCVAARSQRQLREPDIELLSALGNLIGVAMRNYRLYKERELATERLTYSEKKYRQLFENAHDAIWVQDLSGTITAANEAASELFGCTLSELIGSGIERFLSRDTLKQSQRLQKKILSGEGVLQPYTQRFVKEDGAEAILMITTNLISSNGTPSGLQFIGRDITNEVRMQENQQFYLQQVTRAHEEERLRISRDLHDSTAQELIATLRSLEKFCEEDWQLSPDRLRLLWGFHGQLKQSLQEIRQLSRDLRPSVIDDLGLLPAVEWLVEQLKTEHQIDMRLNILGSERRFAPEMEVTLFRIVQEALRNVAKHSGATHAEVTIEFKESETKLTVTDNGRGFEMPASLGEFSRLGKLGVDGMQTRAKLAGGTFDMRSSRGAGTTLTVTIPAEGVARKFATS